MREEVPVDLEFIPSIADIPLPPLEDLLGDDLYAPLQWFKSHRQCSFSCQEQYQVIIWESDADLVPWKLYHSQPSPESREAASFPGHQTVCYFYISYFMSSLYSNSRTPVGGHLSTMNTLSTVICLIRAPGKVKYDSLGRKLSFPTVVLDWKSDIY